MKPMVWNKMKNVMVSLPESTSLYLELSVDDLLALLIDVMA